MSSKRARLSLGGTGSSGCLPCPWCGTPCTLHREEPGFELFDGLPCCHMATEFLPAHEWDADLAHNCQRRPWLREASACRAPGPSDDAIKQFATFCVRQLRVDLRWRLLAAAFHDAGYPGPFPLGPWFV